MPHVTRSCQRPEPAAQGRLADALPTHRSDLPRRQPTGDGHGNLREPEPLRGQQAREPVDDHASPSTAIGCFQPNSLIEAGSLSTAAAVRLRGLFAKAMTHLIGQDSTLSGASSPV